MIGASDITLRDWFAGMAMQGMLAGDVKNGMTWVTLGEHSYEMADLMLSVRDKTASLAQQAVIQAAKRKAPGCKEHTEKRNHATNCLCSDCGLWKAVEALPDGYSLQEGQA